MQGLRDTLESVAYYEHGDPTTETSTIAQRLLTGGASVIEMAKLSTFAGREAPSDGGDYMLPFSPRRGGFQSPAGGSEGCAVAVASYDWVDVGIGTDCEYY